MVNGKDYKDYFPVVHIQGKIVEPLQVTEIDNTLDIQVNVKGGGVDKLKPCA